MTSWKKAYEQCKIEGKTLFEPQLNFNEGDMNHRSLVALYFKMMWTEGLDFITFLGLYYDDKVGIHSHHNLLLEFMYH